MCGKAVRTAHGRAGVKRCKQKKGKLGGTLAVTGDGDQDKHGFHREIQEESRSEEDVHAEVENKAKPTAACYSRGTMVSSGRNRPTTCFYK